jgi:hypothetical protein
MHITMDILAINDRADSRLNDINNSDKLFTYGNFLCA